MTATEPRIDIAKLENVRHHGNKLTARCPACAATGADRSGEHFFLNTDSGKFGCTVGRDAEHRREIFALVGIRGDRQRDPERDREWQQQREEEKRQASAKAAFIEGAKSKRDAIIARHQWNPSDVRDSSPLRLDGPLAEIDPQLFLRSLFAPAATIWTGEVHHSGKRHADHWRTQQEWQKTDQLGPMVSPAIWTPGTVSRSAANVLSAPYVVLDFDGIPGMPPPHGTELKKHIADSLALTRWLREREGWDLAAIIWTGSKSLHCWFHSPPPSVVKSLSTVATALGMDAGLIGRPEHPCRLPGQPHAKTGNLSKIIWLQSFS
jgi:hypothetical protein